LNYGRIENSIAAQEARFRQAVAQYQGSVLNANREVEDSMVSYFKARERTHFLGLSVNAARRTVEITNDQYVHGSIDFTAVFLFESTLTTQEDDLAQSQANIALSLVDLYRALGGGWQEEPNAEIYAAPPATAPTTQRVATTRPGTVPSANH
jgi:outer membrane protein TolC